MVLQPTTAIFTILVMLVYLLAALFFGELAGNMVGRRVLWTVAFFFLPVISHIVFFVYAFRVEKLSKEKKLQREIIYGSPKPLLGTSKAIDYGAPRSVTPFDEPFLKERLEEAMSMIVTGLRDKRVEELITNDQWGKAMEMAYEKLAEARASADIEATHVYEIYLRLIMSRVMPSCTNDPLELGVDRAGNFGNMPPTPGE